MSKRPRILKTTARAASGGVIVIAALLALLFFRGPGLGQGEGDADSDAADTAMASTETPAGGATPTVAPAESAPTAENGGLTPDEERALSDKILAILIDEHEYRLEVPGEAETLYRPIEMERLLELAELAEGDSNGIRIRILRRENARASAEEKLKLELEHVGIRTDAVYMPEEFVP
ncbi:MAG: hypothetical protein NXI04_04940 [Planctomycetaceae bacterium]|nr:hypothetical protein [Planctomycetaceae bacterium]